MASSIPTHILSRQSTEEDLPCDNPSSQKSLSAIEDLKKLNQQINAATENPNKSEQACTLLAIANTFTQLSYSDKKDESLRIQSIWGVCRILSRLDYWAEAVEIALKTPNDEEGILDTIAIQQASLGHIDEAEKVALSSPNECDKQKIRRAIINELSRHSNIDGLFRAVEIMPAKSEKIHALQSLSFIYKRRNEIDSAAKIDSLIFGLKQFR